MIGNQEAEILEEKAAETDVNELKKKMSESEINNSEPVEEKTNGHQKDDDAEKVEQTVPIDDEKPADPVSTEENKDEPETVEAIAAGNDVENKEEPTDTPVAENQESKQEDTQNAINGDGNNETKNGESLGATVAKHYNERPAGSKEVRKESRIFHLRNFNNWAKSTLIGEFLEKIKKRKRTSDDVVVLDLACGKGGDLLKWQKGKVDHVLMADIASTSIDQCKERYARLERESKNSRNRERLFTMEAYASDCTKENLASTHYKKKDIKIDLVSCQFAFHYAFESYDQAEMMVQNACEKLNTGGYWIGTMPDANHLVKQFKASEDGSFGNSVFKITPDNKDEFPLFGSKYMFHLEGVVDCPEFLVHFPVVEKLAEKYGMKLVWKKNFHDLYKFMEKDYSSLLHRMSALETFPASSGKILSAAEEEYAHAKEYMKEKDCKRVGTLTKDEWEAAGIYIAFAFEKVAAEEKKDRTTDKSSDRPGRTSERTTHSERTADRKRPRNESHESRDRHRSRDRRESNSRSKDRRKSTSHRSTSAKRTRKDTEDEQPEFEITDAIECEEEEENKTNAETAETIETPVKVQPETSSEDTAVEPIVGDSVEAAAEPSVEAAVEPPVEAAVETPVEEPTEEPAETHIETPTVVSSEAPVDSNEQSSEDVSADMGDDIQK